MDVLDSSSPRCPGSSCAIETVQLLSVEKFAVHLAIRTKQGTPKIRLQNGLISILNSNPPPSSSETVHGPPPASYRRKCSPCLVSARRRRRLYWSPLLAFGGRRQEFPRMFDDKVDMVEVDPAWDDKDHAMSSFAPRIPAICDQPPGTEISPTPVQ